MKTALDLPPDAKALKYYKYRDLKFEERGPYRLQPLATNSMDERPNLRYPISFQGEEIWPEKQWQWSRDRVAEALAKDEIAIAKKRGEWSVSYKQYLRDNEGDERRSKAYSIVEGIYTQQGTNELKEMFGDGKAFSFPKPTDLIKLLVKLSTGPNDLILDSFAGSGTTGHAVMSLNREDGGGRNFILVEMDGNIAASVTAERLKRAALGYGEVAPLGSGFRFCRLGKTLFDSHGEINHDVPFTDLARYVYLIETGVPAPTRPRKDNPLLGTHEGRAIYLLFNGVLGDKRPASGNVLTHAVLEALGPHPLGPDLPRVVYGEACRLGEATLLKQNVTFRQTPYALRER